MIVTKRTIPRRTVLRGVGATLALPLLDAMVPAFTATVKTAARPTPRFSLVYVPNGINMENWTPETEGAEFTLRPIMQPLAAFQDRMLVLSGLTNEEPARPLPGEFGPHARCSGSFLTAVHPRKTEGVDVRAGESIDQVIAKHLANETVFPSLELGIESSDLAGACDAGFSCAYTSTLSWKDDKTPLPTDNHPRAVFERLFGERTNAGPESRRARLQRDRSILDSVASSAASLSAKLGRPDRGKLDQYLDAVRDVERRIQKAETQSLTAPVPEQLGGIPDSFEAHVKLMFDLQVLAFQADVTRVSTFLVAREISARSYPEIGVSGAHHPISHHSGRTELLQSVIKVNTFHAQLFNYYLEKLRATQSGEGTLLDEMIVHYGASMSEGNSHDYTNIPVLLVGGGAGTLKTGRHVRYASDTPLPNLWVSLLDKFGVPVQRFGNSTGPLPGLS